MNEVIEMEKQDNGKTWGMARARFGKGLAKAGAVVAAAGTSLSAFAVDHTATITAAQTDATTNTTAAVAAVIAVAAVVFGVGIVLRLINR